MSFFRSRIFAACVASTVTALVVGGIAWATIPASTTGTVAACYATSGANAGVLRVINYQGGQRCAAGQVGVSWPSTTACLGWPHPGVNWSLPGSTPGNGCNFILANLDQQNLSHANLTNANLSGASLVLVNLSGAKLTGANITNTNLHDANLSGDNLSGNNLSGVSSHGVIGPVTLPTGWLLTADGYLIGPAANLGGAILDFVDLSNANLSGANLRGASLQSMNLTNANLSSANLTQAALQTVNLTGANLSGANLTDASWFDVTCPDGTLSSTNGTSPESCVGHP